ncbi:MAG: antitoxin [Bifidobacteriaceae bacterium]|jgi:hypothetical protein|nr:antitoxin [Bifidobacteriaceae bacterium]
MDLGDITSKLGDVEHKAAGLVGGHGDQVADAVDKVTDFIDDHTGHKFHSQLEALDDKVEGLLGDK